MAKLRVGLMFGGKSGEHEVSLRSAASIAAALNKDRYDIVPIGISLSGQWLNPAQSAHMLPASTGVVGSALPVPLSVDPTADHGSLDVVFPVMHGPHGEDGTVQGFLEMAGIPYVGAGVLGSAAGMDKDAMKRLFRDSGLPVVEWILLRRAEFAGSVEDGDARAAAAVRARIEAAFAYPVFVKPANLGSSVGISKVHNAAELQPALELAASFDRRILVERSIVGRELECAVLGNDDPQASVVGEIVPAHEFYDYEAKYIDEGSKTLIPAPITAAQSDEIRALACRAFQAIDCAGMARVDFFLETDTGKIYINEINTIPGFTSISMYPKMWEATGLAYSDLLDRLIDLALERHAEKRRTKYVR